MKKIYAAHNLQHIKTSGVSLTCVYTDRMTSIACETVVLVTMRLPVDDLWHPNLSTIRIGDAYGPSTIAAAVYSGHQYALDSGRRRGEPNTFCRELVEISRQTGAILMGRDPRYNILFEPLKIGPVTAKNLFY